jgi:hypothetical protein
VQVVVLHGEVRESDTTLTRSEERGHDLPERAARAEVAHVLSDLERDEHGLTPREDLSRRVHDAGLLAFRLAPRTAALATVSDEDDLLLPSLRASHADETQTAARD